MSIVWKFVVWSALLIVLVVWCGLTAAWNNQPSFSHGTPDFNYWQQKYKDIAFQLATTSDTKEAVTDAPLEVEQYTIQQFPFIATDGSSQQRVDRCESCHIGVENPGMTAENIIKTVDHRTVTAAEVPAYLNAHPATRDIVYALSCHPGKGAAVTKGGLAWSVPVNASDDPADAARQALDAKMMSAHPFATYGCTSCHYGSGRELVQDRAHGADEFWLQPMLPSKYQDAACAQCHESFDAKTYAAVYLPQMTTIARGEQLFKENACWGCHKIEGFSKGNVGPELTLEGRIATFKTIEHQLWDPRYKVNNCVMPYFFSDRIVKDSDGGKYILTPLGQKEPLSGVTPAIVDSDETRESLAQRDDGYIPDESRQADVDALVTFVLAQTGLNYTQAPSNRMARITAYNSLEPQTVPVTAEEGKVLFDESGCYACHYLGDPDNDKNGHGGIAGPNLSWEGARHSRQWLLAHYVNPQAFVPKSIMPIFPFSDSQRAALSLYDAGFIPKGAKPVSPDQDMPTEAMQKDQIVVPQVRYMTR
jgi:mono/diheme cytochrome c family protein